MIDLYTWSTPNGRKISIMLEECNLQYNVKPINLTKDEQFDKEFIRVSRDIHFLNDKRAEIKLNINKILDSNIREIKQYTKY